MDLIKESAFVTENDYKRVTLLFFKETKTLHYWDKYITTREYHNFVKSYLNIHKTRTPLWWDRSGCMEILGMCNFSNFLWSQGLCDMKNIYNLYAAFLGIFWEDEYHKWFDDFQHSRDIVAHRWWVRGLGSHYAELIDNWLKLKNATS